jgi:hypothetical protein
MIRVSTSNLDRMKSCCLTNLSERYGLAVYAREFLTCELKLNIYRIPNARLFARIGRKMPPGFIIDARFLAVFYSRWYNRKYCEVPGGAVCATSSRLLLLRLFLLKRVKPVPA